MLEKAGEVVPARERYAVVLRAIGLQEHVSGAFASSGPPGNLGQQLKQALGRPEVGHRQAGVGGHHPDQRDIGVIVTFGNHLGADQDVDVAVAQSTQNALMRRLGTSGVAVHAGQPRFGKQRAQHRFDLLGAEAVGPQRGPFAPRAQRRHRLVETAVMAPQPVGAAVIRQRHAAMFAVGNRAAITALQVGGKTAPVNQNEALLAALQAGGDGFPQRAGNDAFVRRRVLPLVHQRDSRQRLVVNTMGQGKKQVLAGSGIVKRLHRRGRAAHDHHRPALLSANDGNVPRVVARRFFLLVGSVVLFVNDNKAEMLHRGENRRAGSNGNLCFTARQTTPFVETFPAGKAAVQHAEPGRKTGRKALHELVGQRNFRHQDERRFALAEHAGNRAHVNLGLAAAGNAVQQNRRSVRRRQLGRDFFQSALLGVIQDGQHGRLGGRQRDDPAQVFDLVYLHDPLLLQALDGSRGACKLTTQRLHLARWLLQ